MEKIDSEIRLKAAILQLEIKQAGEGKLLKEQFYAAYESIKPVNLIISTFKEAAESKELKDTLLNTAIGFTTGYLVKMLFQGSTKNPINKLFGAALQVGVTNVVAKNPEVVKSLAKGFFKIIRSKPGKTFNVPPQKTNRSRLDLM